MKEVKTAGWWGPERQTAAAAAAADAAGVGKWWWIAVDQVVRWRRWCNNDDNEWLDK